MDLVIYGDFNCPFSALASARAARLEGLGRARVDWRAVEHDTSLPASGRRVDAPTRATLDDEIATVREQLVPGEGITLRTPSVLVNTAGPTSRYAATEPHERSALRQHLFRAYWADDVDISFAGRPSPDTGTETAARWQREWEAFERRIVPMMVLPDGSLSRGLGALARLATAIGTTAPQPDEGGDAACWAHLLDDEGNLGG